MHHFDGNGLNNDIENLEALPHSVHLRLHAGWTLTTTGWLRPCKRCGRMLPLSSFYRRRTGNHRCTPACKDCNAAYCREERQRRKKEET